MKKTVMKKNVVLMMSTVISLIAAFNASAIDVSGTIVNQTWTSNNSPYRVVGNILVAGLKIESGVTVLCQVNYVFEVAGKLNAIGISDMPHIFTQTNNGGWQGIYFNFSSPGSVRACLKSK